MAGAAAPGLARYRGSRSPLAQRAARRHVDRMLRQEAEAAWRQADIAAQLHLRHPHHAGGHLRAIRQAHQGGAGLALFRDRYHPHAERHRAGNTDGAVAEDRRVEMARGPARYAEPLISTRRLNAFAKISASL